MDKREVRRYKCTMISNISAEGTLDHASIDIEFVRASDHDACVAALEAELSAENIKRLQAQHERDAMLEELAAVRALLGRCLPIVEYDARMMADITRFSPLDAESQAKHDSTEYESEKLLPLIRAATATTIAPSGEST